LQLSDDFAPGTAAYQNGRWNVKGIRHGLLLEGQRKE
jgi:hypothetical protein